MGRKKIEIKYIEDTPTRQTTAYKRRLGMFTKADALAKLGNVELAILLISSNDRPYVFGSPCFDSVVERFENPNLGSSETSTASLKETRILQSRAKLEELKEKLNQQKQHEKDLKKRQEETLKNYDKKKLVDLTMEGFVALKKKLEEVRDDRELESVEMEVSTSLLMLSNNKN